MLERIYVDNYKSLVNFEYRPAALQLILGANGSGKSSVFEVLSLLRTFLLRGATVEELFSARSLTRWQSSTTQTFEIELSDRGGRFLYRLEIEHRLPDRGTAPAAPFRPALGDPRSWVRHETLICNGQQIFSAEAGEAEVSAVGSREVTKIPVDRERSLVPLASSLAVTGGLAVPFWDWVSSLYYFQINPYAMTSESADENPYPLRDLSNYASWYRHLSQEKPRVARTLLEHLKPIIDGLEDLSLSKEGERTRLLRAEIAGAGAGPLPYGFSELSEGQRALVGLYTLLALMKEQQVTLCIDEPDNFVMLAEIQPWLMELREQAEQHDSQVLVISHHPEVIDYLAPFGAALFSRATNGPARVRPFTVSGEEGLPASEVVARGWENE